MSWAKIEIAEPSVRVTSAAIVAAFAEAYRAAGRPNRAILYREYLHGGDRVFWFTPEAVEVAAHLLTQYDAKFVKEAPDIAVLKYISV